MGTPIQPGTLCYVTAQCADERLHHAFVVAVRPLGPDEGVCLGDGTRAIGPHDHDLWWVRSAVEGALLPLCICLSGEPVYDKMRPRTLCRAVHLRPIAGPGLELPADPVAAPTPQPAEAL